jgi:ribulose-phosphate 3-epimerase
MKNDISVPQHFQKFQDIRARRVLVCPSMLSADPLRLGQELIDVERAGADCIHWDIMDGNFVDAISFGDGVVEAHRKISSLRFDVHLMVKNPEKHIAAFANAGADSIIIHVEACERPRETLCRIKNFGKLSGIALNPETLIESIGCDVDVADIVLVMSVNPGKSGQRFMQSQLEKIEKLRKLLPETTEICVDGGINSETGKECIGRGANSLVMGSFLFKSSDYAHAIRSILSQNSFENN